MMHTIGQKLKAAREEKDITLEKVFQAIRIRVNYLQALEEDDMSSMSSPVQARGYLRNYAEYLGLDIDQLLEEVRASQQNDGEIIRPADFTAQPADVPTPQPSVDQEAAPPSPSLLEQIREVEPPPQPESSNRVQDMPVKPKPRGRRKIKPEPEPTPAVDTQPGLIEDAVSHTEPVVEEISGHRMDETPQSDVSDNLWQVWLNRISSMIPVRVKQRSDIQEIPVDGPSTVSQNQDEIPAPEPLHPENLLPSGQIFEEIGIELRERREALSLHLEEVERNIRVKAHYLEALELGAMDRLPSTVQTRGMLSNYASFLDMDVDAILLRFADALQARHSERNPQRPARRPGQPILSNMPALRNFIAGDMIFGIGLAVLMVGFVIWGINRVITLQNIEGTQPTAPSISDVLLASPDPSLFTATPTLLPIESFSDEATPTIIIPTVNINVSVQVNLIAVERTYMRVAVDGEVAFEGRVIPGNAYLFEAEDQVEVLVGSGAALRVVYNGRDLGLMGTFGQIVNNIFRSQEILTPTALPSPTPTNTVPPSPTLRPTNTPVSSQTPIPSSTPVP